MPDMDVDKLASIMLIGAESGPFACSPQDVINLAQAVLDRGRQINDLTQALADANTARNEARAERDEARAQVAKLEASLNAVREALAVPDDFPVDALPAMVDKACEETRGWVSISVQVCEKLRALEAEVSELEAMKERHCHLLDVQAAEVHSAQDRIKALEAENARLRETLAALEDSDG